MQANYKELKFGKRARLATSGSGQITLTRDFYNKTTGELIIGARSDVISLDYLNDLKEAYTDNLADITDLVIDVTEKITEWEKAQIPEMGKP